MVGRSRSSILFGLPALLTWCAFAQDQLTPQAAPNLPPVRALAVQQTHQRLRAGERVSISAPQETVDFIRSAKARSATINGAQGRGFAFGTTANSDEVQLAASLTAPPGEYEITLSAANDAGEIRTATVNVTLDPPQLVPSTATRPPVVLLNGWQFGLSTCPIGNDPFGILNLQLLIDGAPVVYFFDNCVEDPNGPIEDLGSVLGQVLGLIRYDTGALVPQVDLVGHSMGGLIVRSYLAGLHTDGSFSPPANPRVRKFIEIATPNFGSFVAPSFFGTQTSELIPGSPFLWRLATWNQWHDDLRGVDALAIAGNAASQSTGPLQGLLNASDGVVSLSSASLGFARDPSRTRILPYCHTDSVLVDCASHLSIANVGQAPLTGQIVRSFLAGTTAWMAVGTPDPNLNPWLSQYGGMYFGLENAAGTQYLNLNQVSFGTVALKNGPTNIFFYQEFVKGTGTFQASTSLGNITCGPFTASIGFYATLRCKYAPAISAVGPILANTPSVTVQSGGTASISGVGFGQYCSGCAVFAGITPLQILSWSDQTITVSLPATFRGFVQLVVVNAAGSDVIGVEVTPPMRALAQVAAGGNLTTGIFVLNTGATQATYSIQFYDDQGNPMALPFTSGLTNALSGTLPAQGSAYYEAGNPQIQTIAGWARVTSDSSIVVQALFRNNVNGVYYEAAVPSTPLGKEFVIPFDSTTFATTGQPFVTGVAIANLDLATANVTCTARDPNGIVIPNAVIVPTLAPLGHWAAFQFPALNGQRGTIDCVSNTNISGIALRFLGSELSSLPVVTNPASLIGPTRSGAVAQVAAGSNLTTGIFVLNTGNATANFSMGFYGDQGNSIALPFTTGTASTLSGTIPAHGLAYYETGDPQLPLVAGWGLFTADSSIVVQALFRNSVNGTYFEAAIPSTPGGSNEVLFPFDSTTFAPTGQPLVTGVAVANLSATSANVTCTARDPNGVVIPNAVLVPTLAPLGHWAAFQFPALNGQRGTIDCASNTNISATALRFLGSGLSSLSVIAK